MKCDEAIGRLLQADSAADARVRQHLENCPACARKAEMLKALDIAGRESRASDLSPGRIRSVCARASELLSQSGGPRIRLNAAPEFSYGNVAALAAALAVVAGIMLGIRELRQGGSGGMNVPAGWTAAADRQIEVLSGNLDYRLRNFRLKHFGDTKPTSFDRGVEDIRHRVSFCIGEIQEELRRAGPDSPARRERAGEV